jgi:hypothetical protein
MLETRARWNVGALSVGQIIYDDDVMIRREQGRGDVGPDESGPSGYERSACQGILAVTRARIPWATPAWKVRRMIAAAP